MNSGTPSADTVQRAFNHLGPPGTPFTTPEIAAEFDCSDRTIYNRLDSLVKAGAIETKKVGAKGRVWWQPVCDDRREAANGGLNTNPQSHLADQSSLVQSNGEMAERIQEFEWTETPLGPIADWPSQLRVAVDIMLGLSEAIGIYWGDDLRLLYNDAAAEQIGEKHPDALGKPARDVFPEAWDELGPIHDRVMAGEGPVRNEEYYLPLERSGEMEDIWWDSSFNPIPAEDGSVGGVLNISFDVTDRVRAERELRERERNTEQRYRTVLNSMDEGFFLADVVFDRDGEPIDIFYRDSNPAAIEMVGEEFEGRWLTEIDMGYEEHWYEVFGRVASTGEGERHELYAEPDGIWYNFYVFKPEGAGKRRVAVVFEDVTDRKRAETELRESEAQLSNILAQLPIGVGVLNADGRYEVRNDRMEKVLDGDLLPSRDPEKQEEWSATDADGDPLPPEQWPGTRALRGEAVSPGIEFRLDRDGETRWFTVAGVPFKESGDQPKAIGVIQEITERKQREAELRVSERRFRNVFYNDMVPMGVWTDEGEITKANDALLDLLGYTRAELDAGELSWTDRTPPEYHERDQAAVAAVKETGTCDSYEKEFLHKDGHRIPIVIVGGEFDDRRDRGVFLAVDITERKEAEQKLERQAELDAFRVQLTDAIRPLTDPVGVQQEAARVLGEQLEASRTHYAEVEGDEGPVRINTDYTRDGTRSVTGELHFSDFGENVTDILRAGENMVVSDTQTVPGLSDEQRAAYAAIDTYAHITVPLVKDGRITAFFAVDQTEPREWTDTEVEMVEETAERTWAAVERARAEEEIRKSEEKYRTLFESIDEGFMTMKVLFDDDEPVDFRYLETNSAFEEITGYVDVEGERMRDLEPDYEQQRVEKYGRIARTGEAERFTDQAGYLDDRWFDVFAFRIGEPKERTVAVLFTDITERKRRELTTALLVEISNDLSRLSTPDEIIDTVGTRLGEFLDVSTCVFVDIDEANDEATVHHGWNTADVPSLEQTFQVEEYFSDEFARAGRAGETLVVRDTAHDDRANTEAYAQLNVGAFVTVPFHWEGRWVANVTVTTREARDWRRDEIELVEDVAARVFPRIERARAQQALTRSNQSLERLNAATQELIDAEAATIPDRISQLVRVVLDVEYVALWRYNDASGDLEEHAVEATEDVDSDVIEPGTDISQRAWETFVGTEIDVANALDVESDVASPVRSRAFVPLGRHGVVYLGSTGADTFDERTVDLVETVASTLETAWDRAESEQELARQNEELTRLDRLNVLIREVDQVLVGGDTPEGLHDGVCECLADSALFEFVWLGEYDADTDEVRPQAWSGVDSASVEELAASPNGSPARTDLFAAAVRTGEMQVVADIATDARAAPWRETALGLGARSCLAIPLAYDDSIYGVLVVYGGKPQPDERDLDVLSELGQTVGHAIHTVETRQTSLTDGVVELTLQTTTADTPLVRLARELNCVIEFEGLVPGADGETAVFFTARDVSSEAVVAAAERALCFEQLKQLAERDDGHRFKARVTDEPLAAGFLDEGASIRSLTIDAGTATAVVTLAETADVRGFIEGIRRDVPDLALLARRSRRRSLDAAGQLQTAFEERLTPRQREILQLAYRSGYFESPRVQTGQDLSAELDLSQSTFNHHLRGAERRLFEVVFDSA